MTREDPGFANDIRVTPLGIAAAAADAMPTTDACSRRRGCGCRCGRAVVDPAGLLHPELTS